MRLYHTRLVFIPRVAITIVIFLQNVSLSVKAAAAASPPPCDLRTSNLLPLLHIYENGSGWDPEGRVLYTTGTYWKDDEANGTFRGCPCNQTRPCLPKCCPMDQAVNHTSDECVPYEKVRPWFNPIVKGDHGNNITSVNGEEQFVLFHGNGCKYGRTRLDPDGHPEDEFILSSSDGFLSMPNQNVSDIGPEGFCLDFFPEINNYLPFLCFEGPNTTESDEPEEQSECLKLVYILYPLGMCISIFFLFISFFVYAFIPELRNLHGKCLLCHIASLQTAYVFLAIVQVLGYYLTDEFCIVSGFVIYYAFLSTFLWLNIMCIDMCIAFSGLRAMTGSAQERDKKKFLLYVLYAWGLPIIPLCVSLVMEFGPVADYILKPQFRRDCWFQSDNSRVAYFIGPVAVIITVNIGLFLFTAIKIYKLKKETAMLKKGDSRRHRENDDNRQRFNLYLKLFVVMGVNWGLEIISWVAGGSECIWIPADLCNTLQGLFIFLIFVWKDKIRRKLIKRLCPRLAAKLKMHRKKGSSSSDGRSICTVSSTMADGDNIKLSTGVAASPDVAKVT